MGNAAPDPTRLERLRVVHMAVAVAVVVAVLEI